jgi:BirA family biotin operon repressor/biotin-[acetyl-CoA-carboxylase] ligase
MRAFYYTELDSTQDEARRLIENGEQKFYVVSRHQTKSRATQGRKWYSEKNKGLYLSWVTRLSNNIYEDKNDLTEFCTELTLNIAKLLRESLAELFTNESLSEIYIKPINDLYFGSKKLAGILIEHVIFQNTSFIIVGIGLNIKKINYQDEKVCAISLEEIVEFGKELEMEDLVKILNSKLTNFFNP